MCENNFIPLAQYSQIVLARDFGFFSKSTKLILFQNWGIPPVATEYHRSLNPLFLGRHLFQKKLSKGQVTIRRQLSLYGFSQFVAFICLIKYQYFTTLY